jgi:hypothetical protein
MAFSAVFFFVIFEITFFVVASIRPGYPGKNRDDVSLWKMRAKACQKSGPGVWRECPFSWFEM